MPGGIFPPLEVIASWPTPNYVDPETRPLTIVLISIILGAVAVGVLILRLWTRLVLTRNAGIDDLIIVAAMPFVVCMTVAICFADRRYGYDKHVWDNTLEGLENSRKIALVIEGTYVWSAGLIKISILLFFRRLSAGFLPRAYLYAIWATLAYVILYIITFTIMLFFMCTPFEAFWNAIDPIWRLSNTFSCTVEPPDVITASAISVSQDFLVAGLPTLLFWRLKIPVRQRVGLGAIFIIGFFLCVVGVFRIVALVRLYYQTYDETWEAWLCWLWTLVEILSAVTIASAPALKVFMRSALSDGVFRSYNTGTYDIGSATSQTRRSRGRDSHFMLRMFSPAPWTRDRNQGNDVEHSETKHSPGYSLPLQNMSDIGVAKTTDQEAACAKQPSSPAYSKDPEKHNINARDLRHARSNDGSGDAHTIGGWSVDGHREETTYDFLSDPDHLIGTAR